MADNNYEIERKFLVRDLSIIDNLEGVDIKQGYLSAAPTCTVRVRTAGETAYITIKSKPTGLKRLEFEYEIPLSDAEHMLATVCTGIIIHKTRYTIIHRGKEWVLDTFHSPLPDLRIAEIELDTEDEVVDIPEWAGDEVTGNPAYSNSSISQGRIPRP